MVTNASSSIRLPLQLPVDWVYHERFADLLPRHLVRPRDSRSVVLYSIGVELARHSFDWILVHEVKAPRRCAQFLVAQVARFGTALARHVIAPVCERVRRRRA